MEDGVDSFELSDLLIPLLYQLVYMFPLPA
jgi:hypothetical protein